MDDFKATVFTGDIPMPPLPRNPPIPTNLPLPPAPTTARPAAQASTTPLPKPSKKGIEQAKKMLRVFSIQRKQTAPPVKTSAPGNTAATPGATEVVKNKPKIEKERKKLDTHPSFDPLKEYLHRGNEELRRKMEIAELGIPLSLIQPGDTAMTSKAWPSKAMPPTFMLTPEQVNELIMKARAAKAQGKRLKFNYKDYFPDYDNPFQTTAKKTESQNRSNHDIDLFDSRDRSSHKSEKSDESKSKKSTKSDTKDAVKVKSRWDDANKPTKKGASPKTDKVDKKHDKEVNLSDFLVCDSWSIDAEDKSEDSAKPILGAENTGEIPSGEEKTKKIDNPETDLNKEFSELAKSKLRPVVDAFTYEFSDDSTDSIDLTETIIKGAVPKRIRKKLIKIVPIKIKTEKFDDEYENPKPKRSISKSPFTEAKPKLDKSSRSNSSRKNEPIFDTPDYLKESKTDESSSRDFDTPKTQTDTSGFNEPMTPDFEEYEDETNTPKRNEPQFAKEMEESLAMWNFVLKICQPLLFRHDRNKCYKETKTQPPIWFAKNPKKCSCVKDRDVVYEELAHNKMAIVDKVYGCDQITDDTPLAARLWYPRTLEEYPRERVLTTALAQKEEQFVITAPAQKEGQFVITAPAQKEGQFVITAPAQKEGQFVITAPAQKREQIVITAPAQKEQSLITAAAQKDIVQKAGPPLPIASPVDDNNSLDREYEKFMEAVWTDKVENKTKSKKDKSIDNEAYWSEPKPKDATSELGTSMDETTSVDSGKKKKNKKKETSEYWSVDSEADKKVDKTEKKNKKKKKVAKPESSESSDSDSSDDSSSDSASKKKKKKKQSKLSKEKLLRKKKLEKKQRLKKLKEKRLKKMRKLKEKVQKSLEHDEDVGDIIKKEKQKKKDEGKSKKTKKTKPKKKLRSRKRKASSSSSSSSSSESEKEKKKKKRKKESAKKQKKRKTSESYSEIDEEFDMNILKNIKMEQMSDDENKIDDFSPRRPVKVINNKEIVSVTELHNDFIGRTIKEERIDVEERVKDCEKFEDSPSIEDGDDKVGKTADLQNTEKNKDEDSVTTIPSPKQEENDTTPQEENDTTPQEENDTTPQEENDTTPERCIDMFVVSPIGNECRAESNLDMETREKSEEVHRQTHLASDEIVKERLGPQQTEPAQMEARPIETVVSATASRGEIKCDWRPTQPMPTPHVKASRWGMQSKPGDANIVLTQSEDYQRQQHYKIESISDQSYKMEMGEHQYIESVAKHGYELDYNEVKCDQQQYKIETISNVRGEANNDYDGAYADMYGESDRLQYGDCFGTERSEEAGKKSRLSLDDRIGLVLQQSVLAPVNEEKPSRPERIENGILTNHLSPSGRESRVRTARGSMKRVSFADGYNPGQDSDCEQPPSGKKKKQRYGCAWPCPASHADHVPLWDALPPPPPPPGSPPAPPPPAVALPARRSKQLLEIPALLVPPEELMITRLPKGLSHPKI